MIFADFLQQIDMKKHRNNERSKKHKNFWLVAYEIIAIFFPQ